MKLNKLAMVLGLGVALTAGMANAAPTQGNGTVKFTGSIINSVCSIKNNNVEVDLGQVTNIALQKGGESSSKPFKIELQDCVLDTMKGVTTTFTGPEADGSVKGLLALEGKSQGAGIMITNHGNKHIPLGKASELMSLHDGDNTLNFAARLKGLQGVEGESMDVKTGSFTAIANFTLNYL
ncbi:major fimbrial subunit polypeptide, mrfA [Xenorhabdus vietnamensis]|uniref:Major fimbrial subunit polypeptide, mrfA n=1 Tax=Xenorhabdus vietnamensis TaxID=351656 RepID=A0A1Y2SJP1_9GAMM|nr:fimbrial protein [Xenorhabdus vietnamensis]OTA18244.1 major fimbrial subunit polypeptide, mrfA [Xenorhabdus vietnamensis]